MVGTNFPEAVSANGSRVWKRLKYAPFHHDERCCFQDAMQRKQREGRTWKDKKSWEMQDYRQKKSFASAVRDFLPNPRGLSKRVIPRNVHGWKTRMTLGIRIDRRSAETLRLTLPDSRAISDMLFAIWKQPMQRGRVGWDSRVTKRKSDLFRMAITNLKLWKLIIFLTLM